MDVHESSGIGGLSGIDEDVIAARERLVFQWAHTQHVPVAFVLAGGYVGAGMDERGLVGLHRLTIEAATREGL